MTAPRTLLRSPLDLLAEIAERGLALDVVDDALRLRGPRERVDDDLVAALRADKTRLLEVLGRRSAPRPLLPLQQAYLVGRADGGASFVHHEFEGAWDPDRLERALGAVVARHDALRTAVVEVDGEPRQVVYAPEDVEVTLTRHDLSHLPRPAAQGARAARCEELSHRVLPAHRAPLVRADLLVLRPEEMVLVVGHDGLVVDGISMLLLLRDWWRAYRDPQCRVPGPPVPPLTQYLDVRAAGHARAPARRARTYWDGRVDDLAGPPALPAAGGLPDGPPRWTAREVRLDPDRWSALRRSAAAADVTPSAALLTAWTEVLTAWGAAREATLVVTTAHRPPFHPGVAEAVGPFSDTMLVALSTDRRQPFAQRARETRDRLRTALDHRDVSGVELARERARRAGPEAARFPFTFNATLDHGVADLDGAVPADFGREVYTVSQTPQVWLNVFVVEQHGGLAVLVDGVDARFPPGLLDDVVDALAARLGDLATAPAWSAPSGDLRPDAQRARHRAANDTTVPVDPRRLEDAVLARAREDPSAPAVVTSTRTLGYGELVARAEALATVLRGEQEVGRGDVVAVLMPRGPAVVVGILAVLLAGATYLPIDAGFPATRRRLLLERSGARCVLLARGGPDDAVPAGPDGPAVVTVDLDVPAPPRGDDPGDRGDAEDLAYVLYTSGTTGTPKGVEIRHRSVVNVVDDCARRFGVTRRDRFFAISAFTFDLSVYDLFGALSAGAALVLPDTERAADPDHWLDRCGSAGVTVCNSVPAIIALLAEQARRSGREDDLAALRLVLASGDRVPTGLPAEVARAAPRARFVALGGPTETTVWNVVHPVDDPARPDDGAGSGAVPYGLPNANNRAYVLDAEGYDTPDHVEGEICAAGSGLARGYRDDPERTAERFVLDEERGERLYRTGDLGYWRPDGTLAITGRADHQIKVNGHRIEAGEVESALTAHPGVAAAVAVRDVSSAGERLVAHVVSAGADPPSDDALRDALRDRLPGYMVPALLVRHDRLPLTRNGKVDRSALTVPEADTSRTGPAAAPSTPTQVAVARAWGTVLGAEETDLDHGLGDRGVDSLTAARILTEIRRSFGVTIPLERLPEIDTVRRMSEVVDAAGRGAGPARPGGGERA